MGVRVACARQVYGSQALQLSAGLYLIRLNPSADRLMGLLLGLQFLVECAAMCLLLCLALK